MSKESKLFSLSDEELNSRIAGALGNSPVNLFAKRDNTAPAEQVEEPVAPESNDSSTSYKDVQLIEVDKITASPYQTRELEDDEESLLGLAKSIEQKGVIQPVILREKDGQYQLVAGERRLRASKILGLNKIPAIIEKFEDIDALEVSIIENAQRENLNPIEEALSFKLLQEEFKLSQKAIAEVTGKSRVAISNSLRLLNLYPVTIEFLKSGELTAGHGRALLQVEDEKEQNRLARKAVKSELSVRALERIVSRSFEEEEELSEEEEKEILKLERQQTRVANYLDLDLVSLNLDAQGRKRLSLTFESEASWKRFVSKIKD